MLFFKKNQLKYRAHHRGKILKDTLCILQRVSLHVIMRSKGEKVMEGDDVCGNLENKYISNN